MRKHKIERETDMEREGERKIEIDIERTICIQRYEKYKARKRKTDREIESKHLQFCNQIVSQIHNKI